MSEWQPIEMTAHHVILYSLIGLAFLSFWAALLFDGLATVQARRQRDDK